MSRLVEIGEAERAQSAADADALARRESVSALFDPESLERNIRSAWDKLTDAERASGRVWYRNARALCERWAAESGRTVAQCAGALAALSPSSSWASNVSQAAEMILHDVDWPVGARYGANVAKAHRILAGEDIESVIGGQHVKVWHFYCSIMGMSCATAIDRHVLRVAWGIERALSDAEIKTLTTKRYRLVSSIIVAVAFSLGILPAVLQASIWVPIGGTF